MRLFVNGCSFTAGTIESLDGDLNKTWPNVLPYDVTDLSFKGSSNDRILRTTVNKLVDSNPDFVIVQWTFPHRYEYVDDGFVKNALPSFPVKSGERLYYDNKFLTQMYLLQTMLEHKNIPYGFIVWWPIHRNTYRSQVWKAINKECIINCEGGHVIGMDDILHNRGHKLSMKPIIGHENIPDRHYMADGHKCIADMVGDYIEDNYNG